MSIEEIIKVLEQERACVARQGEDGCDRDCVRCDLVMDDKVILGAYDTAISLLRTHQDNQPNEPLTLEELREMHEPVWVSVPVLKNGGYWCLCNGGTIIPPSCQEFDARNIKDWVFYRRPPKEEQHEETT